MNLRADANPRKNERERLEALVYFLGILRKEATEQSANDPAKIALDIGTIRYDLDRITHRSQR